MICDSAVKQVRLRTRILFSSSLSLQADMVSVVVVLYCASLDLTNEKHRGDIRMIIYNDLDVHRLRPIYH